MYLGYNTNGFAHHRLEDAVAILAELGYQGIALTPDVHHFDPQDPNLPAKTEALRTLLNRKGLLCVIETGARFVLDPRRKHQPTLLSAASSERVRRREFLRQCIDLAENLGAKVVSFWSGTALDDSGEAELMNRLTDNCRWLADAAAEHGVQIAFEPEPGMFIDTLDRFADLHARVNHPAFGLTIDIGHLLCQGELPISRHLTAWKDWLWNVHIEDMRRGVHDHLMFGAGEVDFADVFAGLSQAGYDRGLYVELSRHSHDAVATARKSRDFLASYLPPRVI